MPRVSPSYWCPLAFVGAALVACSHLVAFVAAQPPPPPPEVPVARLLPPMTPADAPPEPPLMADPAIVLQSAAQPLTLPIALRLSQTNNLDIAQAREFVRQAGIVLDRARIGFVPTFNIGSAYNHHEGTIQKTEGNIIFANRDSLFVGGGPSLNLSFSDAFFAPLVARQLAAGSEAAFARQMNDTLLAVADAYFEVLRVRRRLARIEETLDYLASERAAPGRAGSKGLLPVVQSVQLAGGAEASRAEVERVRIEVLRRREEKAAVLREFRAAMAELARLVRLDPQVPLWPAEDFRFPMPLPGAAWTAAPLEELVRVALSNRPELAESQALIRAAVERVRTAKYRPFMPNVVLAYNWGDFGGGPDTNPNIITPATKTSPAKVTAQPGFAASGSINRFDPRTDFDVALVWKFQNMGFGDIANVREQRSRLRQSEFVQLQVQDRVVAQVVQVNELMQGARDRVRVMQQALFDPDGAANGPVFQALRLNFDRIRTVPTTRPLEVLDSIRGLNDTLEAYGQAITDFERTRFRLLVVLGLPPRELLAIPGLDGACAAPVAGP
jgi:outer membrane protein TolC